MQLTDIKKSKITSNGSPLSRYKPQLIVRNISNKLTLSFNAQCKIDTEFVEIMTGKEDNKSYLILKPCKKEGETTVKMNKNNCRVSAAFKALGIEVGKDIKLDKVYQVSLETDDNIGTVCVINMP